MLLLAGLPGTALAIATSNDTISARHPADYSYDLNWDHIYRYKYASSVAVDHYWILAAAHVADDGGTGNLVIDGETYTQQEIVFHPSADLALVRYDKPFPGYYSLFKGEIYTGNGNNPAFSPLVMVGYGYNGAVSPGSFAQGSTEGIKRWGTNRGVMIQVNPSTRVTDYEFAVDIDPPANVMKYTQCFKMAFDLGNTTYEAGGNTLDSGAPIFIEDDTGYKLAGIILYRLGSAENVYTGNYAALVPDYIDWITDTIYDYDTDMDGLPDWWETEYGETEAGDDPDADGFTNYEEWLADTLPNDSNSFLRVTEYADATHLEFSSSINRQYQIQYRLDLTDSNETWETEVDWFTVTGSQTVKSVSTAAPGRFYRVRARFRE